MPPSNDGPQRGTTNAPHQQRWSKVVEGGRIEQPAPMCAGSSGNWRQAGGRPWDAVRTPDARRRLVVSCALASRGNRW